MMGYASLFATLAVVVVSVQALTPCYQTYVPHEIMASSSSGTKTITDDGTRTMTTKAYSVGCPTFPYTPTGTKYAGDTAVTLNVSLRAQPERCRAEAQADGSLLYTSFQALVMRTPGWSMTPKRWRIRDIDNHVGASGVKWTETLGVFGLYDSEVVHPTMDTNLTKVSGVLKASDSGALEISTGTTEDIPFPALKATNLNCGFTDDHLCDTFVDFNKPIDTLVVLMTVMDKTLSVNNPRTGNMTGVLLGQLKSKCGCRCNLQDLGSRTVHIPTAAAGECTRKITSAAVTKCAPDGPNWCSKEPTTGYISKGALLPSGNVKCDGVERTLAKFVQAFEG